MTFDFARKPIIRLFITVVLLTVIFAVGAYLRFDGLDWDEDQHLHPDERFLTMVTSNIRSTGGSQEGLGPPPTAANQPWRNEYPGTLPDCEAWGGYFDTACSPLNPHNRGYTFYVYGTLPIFIARYVGEWVGQVGYGDIHLVGRMLSAAADLLSLWLVYWVGTRLYDRRVGVLAAGFSAFAVLQIQQSHFYTVDTYSNLFMMLTVAFAVEVMTRQWQAEQPEEAVETLADGAPSDEGGGENPTEPSFSRQTITYLKEVAAYPLFWPSVLFGLALGAAVASKINAAPIAVILPLAAGLYYLKLSKTEQRKQALMIFVMLVIAGITSVAAFRVFQPYAFRGPGFFGVMPNKAWLDNLSALRAQTSGDVDFPPALQWARRPVTFSWQNMVLWGLGPLLGILAWTGFAFMGWRMIKGEWQKHILLWGWTAIYFGWQTMQWNSTLRYQLPIYPLLAIIAAWFVVDLYARGQGLVDSTQKPSSGFYKAGAVLLGTLVLSGTAIWALAFSGIYPKMHTRIEAARWLFQEMPGPVTLRIDTDDGLYNQPLPYQTSTVIRVGQPVNMGFNAFASGTMDEIYLPHVVDKTATPEAAKLFVEVAESQVGSLPLGSGQMAALPSGTMDGLQQPVILDQPVGLLAETNYYITVDVSPGETEIEVCLPITLQVLLLTGPLDEQISLPQQCLGRDDLPVTLPYMPQSDGSLTGISLQFQEIIPPYADEPQTLLVEVLSQQTGETIAQGQVTAAFAPGDDGRGDGHVVSLETPATLKEDEPYGLRFTLLDGQGELGFSGAAPVNETSWDDGLPLRIDGYDPFGGIYEGGLNFEMYWDDNEDKYERFVTNLDRGDYVLISSSRQWGTTTRLPERYPLTTEYYRHLIGCPPDESIEWCYTTAEVDTFQGDLGFDLAAVFVSNPTLGPITINDQFAEEAFTVYDHPKVFVFKKADDYDPARVREILGAVDLSTVVRITPKQADSYPGNLMLPSERLHEQQSGGTWSALFDYESLQNKYPIMGVILWYVVVMVLGWLVYPVLRYVMPGLADRGYPLARMAGLIILAYFSWLAGSVQIPFSRLTIGVTFLGIAILGVAFAYKQRDELRKTILEQRKYFLLVEGLFLAFFMFGLLVRVGNPDLWHPWKGGEKPMDFSYFNAVLKSTSFPPYDPWFSGGYINYYYYGFVIVGVMVKLLGIVPSIAYNIILPTLLALMGVGAFSIGWNLIAANRRSLETLRAGRRQTGDDGNDVKTGSAIPKPPLLAGLMAAFFMAILGNLGTLRMLLQGFQQAAAGSMEQVQSAGIFMRMLWGVEGFFKVLTGSQLPYRPDEWYWNPSRVIGAEHGGPITEFPYFTFLYGDLHAHLIALPIALLAIAWALSVVFSKAWQPAPKRSYWQIASSLFFGGLVIGALFPVNLSDMYTYLPLGLAAIAFAVWKYQNKQDPVKANPKKILFLIAGLVGLVLFSLYLYAPYSQWYGQGYSEIRLWKGTRTPIGDYITHWGAFLFVLVSWLFYETVQWMATTPLSALRKLEPYRGTILTALLVLVVLLVVFGVNLYPEGIPPETKIPIGLGVHTIWLILPLGIWTGLILFKPGITDAKRAALFMAGTGLALTLMVEIIVVSGDIGRMNTVFKFYLHVWTLFAVVGGAAVIWLWQSLPRWPEQWRTIWQLGLTFVLLITALFPMTATLAKIQDRMAKSAPHTLDGMTYLKYAVHHDEGVAMDLSQDYDAIRWLQDHVIGSPVIVEAHQSEYRWSPRVTIYTGLPNVLGYNWHQRQQRTLTPDSWVWDRANGIEDFYLTTNPDQAAAFLARYDVEYIVLGQLERAKYAGEGLEKFEEQNGILWDAVYRDRDTVVYQVIDD